VEGSCEHGNELLVSIKCWDFLEKQERFANYEEGLSSMKLVEFVCLLVMPFVGSGILI
jgi:hypothetical protein